MTGSIGFSAMRPFFLMIAMAGCSSNPVEIADPIVERAVRDGLKKPTGELTKEDLEKVNAIGLGYSQITDASLKEVAKLANLTQLDLRFTQITDTGLKEVAKMKKLTKLYLANTKVTKQGIAQIQKELPKCYIIAPPNPHSKKYQ
jgi:Leucine-rich repeat (LRR) protein